MKNYYQVLGLDESATFEEVRRAYLKYANKFHPDKHNNDDFFKERFQEIHEAYEYIRTHQTERHSNESSQNDEPPRDEPTDPNKGDYQQVDINEEALKYYDDHEIEILNEYGFFQQKKKRQASTIWAACLISMGVAFLAVFVFLTYIGANLSSPLAIFLYIMALFLGYLPGMYVGPAIMGIRDKSQFRTLEENIKRQFIKDYIKSKQ